MKTRYLAPVVAILLALCSATVFASDPGDRAKDSDVRLLDAKVVEVADAHISVIARSGVEHVIAVDRDDTHVKRDGQPVSIRDLHEGDVITIELDAQKPIKFARNISFNSQSMEVARNRR